MRRYEYDEPVMEIIFMGDQDVVRTSNIGASEQESYEDESGWTGFV